MVIYGYPLSSHISAVQGACGKPTTLTLIQGTVIYYMILHATMA